MKGQFLFHVKLVKRFVWTWLVGEDHFLPLFSSGWHMLGAISAVIQKPICSEKKKSTHFFSLQFLFMKRCGTFTFSQLLFWWPCKFSYQKYDLFRSGTVGWSQDVISFSFQENFYPTFFFLLFLRGKRAIPVLCSWHDLQDPRQLSNLVESFQVEFVPRATNRESQFFPWMPVCHLLKKSSKCPGHPSCPRKRAIFPTKFRAFS